MTVDAPLLLAVGLLVTVGLGAAAAVFTRRRTAALRAAGLAGRTARLRGPLGIWLTVAGIGVLSVAAAGPSALVPVPRTAGTVILAVDVSGSMGADDVVPTRLDAAQSAAREFIRSQPASVDIGVVAFENGALITAPPSGDHEAAIAAVDRLTVTGGTSLAAAILGALSAITGRTVSLDQDRTVSDMGYWPSATIVMLTDGEDQTGETPDDPAGIAAAAAAAQQAGVAIHTIGVGTAQGGVVTVDRYRLHTALDSDTLTAIAETTGGSYQLASDVAALSSISGSIEQRLTVEDQQVPLAGGFIVGALALLAAGATATLLRTGRVI